MGEGVQGARGREGAEVKHFRYLNLHAPAPADASQRDALGFDEATESRWQKAIYEQCKRILPNVDGSGCESGDALDVTISEITQCFAHLQDERDSLRPERGGQEWTEREKEVIAELAQSHQELLAQMRSVKETLIVTEERMERYMLSHYQVSKQLAQVSTAIARAEEL